MKYLVEPESYSTSVNCGGTCWINFGGFGAYVGSCGDTCYKCTNSCNLCSNVSCNLSGCSGLA